MEERDQFKKLQRALSTLTLTMTHDYGKKASDAYGVNGIPHLVIIGRDGKVIAVHRGYGENSIDSIVAEINAALAAPTANVNANANTNDNAIKPTTASVAKQ